MERGIGIAIGLILVVVFFLLINSLNVASGYKTILYLLEFVLIISWFIAIVGIGKKEEGLC